MPDIRSLWRNMELVPDSSFFICFLDDLEGHLPIATRQKFMTDLFKSYDEVIVVPAVKNEVYSLSNSGTITDYCHDPKCVELFENGYSNPVVELLRGRLGKGELQVITYANHKCISKDYDFRVIIDDLKARNMAMSVIPDLKNILTGTIGIIKTCAISNIYDARDSINLLKEIEKSPFRIKSYIIDETIKTIKLGCDLK